MKKYIFAVLAIGAAVAFITSALADSHGYRSSGSNAVASLAIDLGHEGFTNGVAKAGASAVRGNELNLLLSGFSNRGGANSANSGHMILGDKGSARVSNGIARGSSMLMAGTATLAATPESGSLFLLGSGLLGMALVVFRKAAKGTAKQ